jgi:uncharacterized protein
LPANLTPDYRAAEDRFKAADSAADKLAALDDMLATIPKHKGTEKMQADIKKRIAKFKQEAAKKPSTVSRSASLSHIDKEGAGQVILIGPPNSGKSSILDELSNAAPEVADYAFTTRVPEPGMAMFENIQMQYIDMPPYTKDTMQPWMLSLIRGADAAILVLDAGDDDVLDQLEEVMEILREANITLHHPGVEPLPEKFIPTIVAANKVDLPDSAGRIELIREYLGKSLPVVPLTTRDPKSLENLSRQVFYDVLKRIRIYTRAPGKKVDYSEPYVLPQGTNIVDAARWIHKDLARNMKYARCWGKNVFDGQMVPRDYIVQDGDIVEFHT